MTLTLVFYVLKNIEHLPKTMCQALNGRAPKLDSWWEHWEMWLLQTARSAQAFPASPKPQLMISWPLIRPLELWICFPAELKRLRKKMTKRHPANGHSSCSNLVTHTCSSLPSRKKNHSFWEGVWCWMFKSDWVTSGSVELPEFPHIDGRVWLIPKSGQFPEAHSRGLKAFSSYTALVLFV